MYTTVFYDLYDDTGSTSSYTTVYFNPDAVGGTTYGQPLCYAGTTAPSLPGGTITPSLPLNALDAAGTVLAL